MIMNKLTKAIGAIALITMGLPTPALADYSQQGGMKSTDCFKKVYREEYIPGTGPSNPGRVRKYYERQRVACAPGNARRTPGQHGPSRSRIVAERSKDRRTLTSMITHASKGVLLEGWPVGV